MGDDLILAVEGIGKVIKDIKGKSAKLTFTNLLDGETNKLLDKAYNFFSFICIPIIDGTLKFNRSDKEQDFIEFINRISPFFSTSKVTSAGTSTNAPPRVINSILIKILCRAINQLQSMGTHADKPCFDQLGQELIRSIPNEEEYLKINVVLNVGFEEQDID